MKTITRHLVPNVGTLVIIGLLFLGQSVGAQPGAAPAASLAPSQTLISYQGTLTDPDGNPVDNTASMEFALFDALTGGNLLWGPETHSVSISNGLFSVRLGSTTPIDPAYLSGDLFLDIRVNGEIMSPRELLTGVAYAMESGTLSAGAATLGDLGVNGMFTVRGSSDTLWFRSEPSAGDFNIYHMEDGTKQLSIFGSGTAGSMDVEIRDGDLAVAAGNLDVNGYAVVRGTSGALRLFSDPSAGDFNIYHSESGTKELSIFGNGSSATMDVELYDGDLTLRAGNLDMNGNSVINCGALTEANLQTRDELAAERIDRFEEGDVLCWGDGQLEKCAQVADPEVQAVADKGGRPIVIGAELIKVSGPVKKGDFLVASDVPGYATATRSPAFGAVIAQALEDFDGEAGIIKAMIRKM